MLPKLLIMRPAIPPLRHPSAGSLGTRCSSCVIAAVSFALLLIFIVILFDVFHLHMYVFVTLYFLHTSLHTV